MDRKKTILVAVMVNAGLLVVLFIAALSSRDDLSGEIVRAPLSKVSGPLFPSDADLAFQQLAPVPVTGTDMQPVEIVIPEITHRLPHPVIESAPTPVVADVKVHVKEPLIEVSVKKGDTLDKIAKANHTTIGEIIQLNHLPGSFLKVGQILKLPDQKTVASTSKPSKPVECGPEYYVVKVGDNPWGIAMKHHMKLEELLKLNQLNEEKARKLKPGDRLRTR